jgi:hypothetical protein
MAGTIPDFPLKPDGLLSGRKMARQIRIEELTEAYKTGVGAKASKWFSHFQAATGIADAAKSDAAEGRYNAAMTQVLGSKLRQKGLAGITDADIKGGVTNAGQWSGPAQAKAAKFTKKFAKYAAVINQTLPTLPPRGTDPAANVTARVVPLAVALHNAKLSGT